MRMLLTNATLIDCVQSTPKPGTAVAIGDDGRICEIATSGRTIDAGNDGEASVPSWREHVIGWWRRAM